MQFCETHHRQSEFTLVVGLGNPGPTYRFTRHNIGFRVVEHLAEIKGIRWIQSPFEAQCAKGCIEGHTVVLAKPMAFMNRSGPPVRSLITHLGITASEMIVVHDDIDLAFGILKIKAKGGHGGHNGLRSITDAIGDDAYTRVRIGIGRPEPGQEVTGHVLGPFRESETERLDEILDRAADAVIAVIRQGTMAGMNQFNRNAK
ncbi:MAG: aminoacyl-tRNA hydrolase [Desulfobacterales bacterium]